MSASGDEKKNESNAEFKQTMIIAGIIIFSVLASQLYPETNLFTLIPVAIGGFLGLNSGINFLKRRDKKQ